MSRQGRKSATNLSEENIVSEETIPTNPLGGRTLIVDPTDQGCYPTPSAALKDAAESDQVYVRPGIYEDKIVVTQRPIRLIGAGRDSVQIFCRRSGPLYLQEVPEGWITGITFRYVGSDQHSALNILNSTCIITQCRAMEGILSVPITAKAGAAGGPKSA